MSQDTNHIEELFRSKLQNLESPVDSQLWQSIQAGMQANAGTSAAAATKAGLSGLTKGLIIASAVVGVGVATWIGVQSSDDKQVSNTVLVAEDQDVISDDNLLEVNDNQSVNTEEVVTIKEVKLQTNKCNLADVEVQKQEHIYGAGLAISKNSEELEVIKKFGPNVIPSEVVSPVVVSSVPKTNVDKVGESIISNATAVHTSVDNSKNVHFNRLPNVFLLSHAGDFTIDFSGEFKDFSISILDQNQNAIFTSDSPSFNWTGEDKFGQKVSPGDYLYLIIGTDVNNNKIQKFQSLKVLP